MIQFADIHTTPLVRQMWKTCFDDTEEFMDIQFGQMYKNENTLIYFEGDAAVASLQMLPYTITFYGEQISFAYLAGLCTLPQHRKKGYMAKLINEAHRILTTRGVPLAILIPAEDWLYEFYEKYGYQQIFEPDDEPIPLSEILNSSVDDEERYEAFCSLFEGKDFCVQKTKAEFLTIVEEYLLDGCPVKNNLAGMARIIDAKALLILYARKNRDKQFSLKIRENDTIASQTYFVDRGEVSTVECFDCEIEVDERMLCRLLFGYKVNTLDEPYISFFTEHHPIMNLMLE